jgi:hypothetical protein
MKPLQAKPETKAREDAQRRAVRARDYKNGQPACRFEVWSGSRWRECGKKSATDTAHIYRRINCARAWDHVDVALLACRECHTAYDSYSTFVRVPPAREERAWATIIAHSKVAPVRHRPPEIPENEVA